MLTEGGNNMNVLMGKSSDSSLLLREQMLVMEYITLLHLPLAAGAHSSVAFTSVEKNGSLHLAVGLNDQNFREAAVNLLYTHSFLKMEENVTT